MSSETYDAVFTTTQGSRPFRKNIYILVASSVRWLYSLFAEKVLNTMHNVIDFIVGSSFWIFHLLTFILDLVPMMLPPPSSKGVAWVFCSTWIPQTNGVFDYIGQKVQFCSSINKAKACSMSEHKDIKIVLSIIQSIICKLAQTTMHCCIILYRPIFM